MGGVFVMHTYEDLTGRQFTYLTVLSRDTDPKYKRVTWKCLCKCGKIVSVSSNELKRKYGSTKSCGCRKHETQNVKHGLRHTRVYNIWTGICQRCYNPHTKEYKNYGGRGIEMCFEWHKDFLTFYNWAMSNGYQDNLTIERIDNNGNYCPENCKWITLSEQANNRRNTIYIEHAGQIKTIKEWAELYGVDRKISYQRYWRAHNKSKEISFEEMFSK